MNAHPAARSPASFPWLWQASARRKAGLQALLLLSLCLTSLGLAPRAWAEPLEERSTEREATERPPEASANEPQQDDEEKLRRALSLGHQGLAAFAAGRFEEALGLFNRAEELVHSPVFVLHQARCLARLGRVQQSRDAYRSITEEDFSSEAPAAWKNARSDASQELAELPSTDEPAPWGRADVEAAQVPPTESESSGQVEAQERGRREPQPSISEDGTEPSSLPAASERLEPRQAGALVAWLVAGGATAFAGFSASQAISKANELKASCDGTTCPLAAKPLYDDARRFANWTSIGIVVGGAAAATGVALWLWPNKIETDAQGYSPLKLEVTPSFVRLHGHF